MNTPRPDADMMWSSPAPVPATPAAPAPPDAPTSETPSFPVVRRGFDQAKVLERVGALTAELRSAQEQVRRLRAANDQATEQRDAAIRERDAALRERSRRPEPYEQVSARVAEVLAGIDRDVDRIKAEATVEGELIVANARTEADRLRRETEASRAGAARSLADLQEQREAMLDQLRRTCGDFLGVIQGLASSIDARDADPSGDGTVVVPEVAGDRSVSR